MYFLIGAISTILFVSKLILMVFGGDHELEHDSSDIAFKLLSVQSILAFLMGFGWIGYFSQNILWSILFGISLMLLSSLMMYLIYKLEQPPDFEVKGKTGTVTIGIYNQTTGKIALNVRGATRYLDAISEQSLVAGTPVVVTGKTDDGRYIVTPI